MHPGEVFGLLGANGAGKTSTVEILEGLRPRSGGEVKVLDFDPDRQKRKLNALSAISMVLMKGERVGRADLFEQK